MQTNTNNATRPIFLRESSGFVRELGVWDVFVLNIFGYAMGLSLATNPTILGGLYPNAEIHWVLVFGLILSVFSGLTYALFAIAFPRSGGDYIYISRTLGPWVGFLANWGFTLSQVYGIGVFSGWAIRDSLSPALLTLGYTLNTHFLVSAGMFLSKPISIFALGLVLLLACFGVALLPQRTTKRVLTISIAVAFVSTLLMLWPYFTTSHDTFVQTFNQFIVKTSGLQDGYTQVIEIARKEGGFVPGQSPSVFQSFLALPVGFLIFFGFTYSAYVGGEVQEPRRSQIVGMLAALLCALVVSWIGMGSYYSVVGKDFNNAVSIVKSLPSNPLPAGGSMVFFSGILISNPIASILMNIGSLLWFILLPIVMTQICIRNIFAWAFDHILPEWFGHISSGNRATHAAIVVILLAGVFLTLDSLAGFPYINYVTLFSVCFCVAGIAGMVFPFTRPGLFKTAPKLVQTKVFGVPLLSICGLVTAGMFAVIVWSALTNTAFSGVKAGLIPHVALLIAYGAGLLVWLARRRGKAFRDGRAELLFERMPPE